jgi:hypothetical protein
MNRGKQGGAGTRKTSESVRQSNKSTVLQNMSTPPSTQIQHRSPFRRALGRGIVFAIPAGQDPLAKLLDSAGPGKLRLSGPEDAERDLRQRIDAHARTLALPAAALVTDREEPGDELCKDLLSVATVLSKSSSRVFLRDKAPNLDRIRPGRRVVLIVPDERRS